MMSWLGFSRIALVGLLTACVDVDSDSDSDAAGMATASAPDSDSSTSAPASAPSTGPDGSVGTAAGSLDASIDASNFLDASFADVNVSAPAPAPPGADRVAATVSNVIASVAFDHIENRPVPVLLFAGGYASYNVSQIVKPIDIAYDLVEHPASWPLWRRGPMGVELQTPSGWKTLLYKYECGPLPVGTKLAGTFEVRGSVTAGAEAARKWVNRYRFAADGTFEYCDMTTTAIVVLGSVETVKTEHRGTYELDGYKVQFALEGAGGGTHALFYDPVRPTRLWLNRAHYTQVADGTPLCVAP